jgi:phage regulator Rha-like protein
MKNLKKKCPRCNRVLALSKFSIDSYCKECRKEYNTVYYATRDDKNKRKMKDLRLIKKYTDDITDWYVKITFPQQVRKHLTKQDLNLKREYLTAFRERKHHLKEYKNAFYREKELKERIKTRIESKLKKGRLTNS